MILLIYAILSIVHQSFNPTHFLFSFRLILCFYISITVFLCFYRTINYIEKIEYNKTDKKIIFTINHFNKQELVEINVIDLSMNLTLYDIITRTSNYYLSISVKGKCLVKQYDYYPWTNKKMREIIDEIKKFSP